MTGFRVAFFLLIISFLLQSYAPAQQDLSKFEKQLEQIRRDQYLRIDQSVPPERRALVDYGAYVTLSYLSVDDQNNDNHVLRQYEIVGYGRVNIDNVHEFFVRGAPAIRISTTRTASTGTAMRSSSRISTPPTIDSICAARSKRTRVRNRTAISRSRRGATWPTGATAWC
jgi:hypothetical protein